MTDLKFTLKTDEHKTTITAVQDEGNQLRLFYHGTTDVKIYIDLDGRLCADLLDVYDSNQVIPLRYTTRVARRE